MPCNLNAESEDGAVQLGQHIDVTQQQTLHLTLELQQGLTLLQLNAADLVDYVNSCIEQNPVLVDDAQASDGYQATSVREDETVSSAPLGDASFSTADANRTAYSNFDQNVGPVSSDALLEGRGHGSAATFDNERRDLSQRSFSIDRYLEVPETLAEHLMTQMRLQTDDPRSLAIAEFLTGNLDSSGYLTISTEETAQALGVAHSEVETVLDAVHKLQPSGVAARNLAECLRLQLEAKGCMTPVLDDLLENHLDKFLKKSAASIAHDMGVETSDIASALEEIRNCNPRPGMQFFTSPSPIWPEVLVVSVSDGYEVQLRDLGLPELKVSEHYRTLATTTRDKDTAHYIKDRIREAESLMEGIAYRRETLYKTACCIVEMQVEFFDEGFERLRPLTMAQVADIVGVSPSTVSRLANGNYMQTPRGTFELRFFFHSAAQGDSSVEVSSISVKKRIRELIDAEDPKRPLSDQKIADALQEEGVDISRRTIAKYRDQMGIPVKAARVR